MSVAAAATAQPMSSNANGSGPPDAKKFRFSLPTQVVVQQPLFNLHGHSSPDAVQPKAPSHEGQHLFSDQSLVDEPRSCSNNNNEDLNSPDQDIEVKPEIEDQRESSSSPTFNATPTCTNSFEDENESCGTKSEQNTFSATDDFFKVLDIKPLP
uniref:Uncharacterized protein n=1 Tax=Ditylenchus dipsaci TaxID=166011 RepID=A0A915DMW5_9BILA